MNRQVFNRKWPESGGRCMRSALTFRLLDFRQLTRYARRGGVQNSTTNSADKGPLLYGPARVGSKQC